MGKHAHLPPLRFLSLSDKGYDTAKHSLQVSITTVLLMFATFYVHTSIMFSHLFTASITCTISLPFYFHRGAEWCCCILYTNKSNTVLLMTSLKRMTDAYI